MGRSTDNSGVGAAQRAAYDASSAWPPAWLDLVAGAHSDPEAAERYSLPASPVPDFDGVQPGGACAYLTRFGPRKPKVGWLDPRLTPIRDQGAVSRAGQSQEDTNRWVVSVVVGSEFKLRTR